MGTLLLHQVRNEPQLSSSKWDQLADPGAPKPSHGMTIRGPWAIVAWLSWRANHITKSGHLDTPFFSTIHRYTQH